MKVLIIEDEELAYRRLVKLLSETDPSIQVEGPVETVKAAIRHLTSEVDYDLIFLDIQLADGKSFSIFETIKLTTPVIFTTAYDEYAIKAFELNSVDYLLKPISSVKLKSAIDKYHKMKEVFGESPTIEFMSKLMGRLKVQTEVVYQSRFLVSKGDSLYPVSAEEIAYFSAEDKVVFLVTTDGKRWIINNSLEELEDKLDPKMFFRVNRQHFVSIQSIRKVHHYFNYKLKLDLHPEPGEEVIVSKARAADFKSWMNG